MSLGQPRLFCRGDIPQVTSSLTLLRAKTWARGEPVAPLGAYRLIPNRLGFASSMCEPGPCWGATGVLGVLGLFTVECGHTGSL